MSGEKADCPPNLSRRGFLKKGAAAASAAIALERAARADTFWQQASGKMVRMGVVGGRFGLSFHWNEHPNCVVEAVSDLMPDRRERLMGKYKCEKTYDRLEQMLLDPAVDAIAIFTGAPDHARHVIACMEHGKHVISAVPACMTLDEAAAIKEAKERTGRKYMMAETSYYRWPTITARRLLTDGLIGDLIYTEGEYYHPLSPQGSKRLWFQGDKRTWRYGFPPMHYPTHSTGFFVGVSRERLVKVSCIGTRNPDVAAYSDNVYENPYLNGMGMFLTDKGRPFRCNVCWDLYGHGERAQWFGRNGALYMPGSGGQPLMLRVGNESFPAQPDYWHMLPPDMRYDSGHGASHPFITNEFVMAIIEDREPAINVYEALAMTVPGIIAHESSFKDGEQLDIPSFDPA